MMVERPVAVLCFQKGPSQTIQSIVENDISYLNNNYYILNIIFLSFTHYVQSVVSYWDSLALQVMKKGDE